MKKILSLLTAVFALSISSAAKADPIPGWYLGAGAAAHMPTTADTHVNGIDQQASYDTGWGIVGDVGYGWANGLRAEGELTEMRANADRVNGVNGTGRLNNFDVMANLYYDFKTGSRWTPYLGAGLGFADVDADHVGRLSNGGSMNDSSVEFAYQGIAGVSYQMADHWSVSTDYRYIRTTDPTFKTASAAGNANTENASHNIVLSVRYTMYTPEAPAPRIAEPAPAPAPAPRAVVQAPAPMPQSYMVFFDFDKSNLTPEALQILNSAATDYKKGGYVRIVVTGHTDTVGTVTYNQKLSERRANAVKEQLVKLGVDPNGIMATGVGKNGLLVPTADQVREAKNRRAEIVFSKE